MKTCPKCNMSFPDDAKFCPKCGARQSSNTVKIIVIFCLTISAIVAALFIYQTCKEQWYIKELAQNAPSGFRKGIEDNWIYQDYLKAEDNSCAYLLLENKDEYLYWFYDSKCEIEIRELRCTELRSFPFYEGKITGFAHYYGPVINNIKSHHKYYVKGTIKNGVWIFDTFDKEGVKCDHFEGGWRDGDLTGICTNKNGTEIKFRMHVHRW